MSKIVHTKTNLSLHVSCIFLEGPSQLCITKKGSELEELSPLICSFLGSRDKEERRKVYSQGHGLLGTIPSLERALKSGSGGSGQDVSHPQSTLEGGRRGPGSTNTHGRVRGVRGPGIPLGATLAGDHTAHRVCRLTGHLRRAWVVSRGCRASVGAWRGRSPGPGTYEGRCSTRDPSFHLLPLPPPPASFPENPVLFVGLKVSWSHKKPGGQAAPALTRSPRDVYLCGRRQLCVPFSV